MGEPTFHAGTKLRWIEQVAGDSRATPFHVRVVVAISRRIDGHGCAIVSQERIAKFIGATERGVRKALVELGRDRNHPQGLGHLAITPGGAGRGNASVYRPVLWANKAEQDSAFSASHYDERRNHGSGNSEAQKAEQRSTKGGTVVPPLPTSSSKRDSLRARTRDPGADVWEAVVECLRSILGTDVTISWFGRATLDAIDGETATIAVPSKFLRSHIVTHFEHNLLAAWQVSHPAVKIVRVVLRESASDSSPDVVGQRGTR